VPELPEVETVVRDLRRRLPGRSITRIELGRRQPLKTSPARILGTLQGARVESVERWGKNIVIRAVNGGPVWWLLHLGMSGRITVEPAFQERLPHTHGVFALDDGREELRYVDPRMFGRIEVRRDLPPRLARLGPEPLEISRDDFVARLRNRRARLKAVLLDQSFVRGVGNIYADESLFRARLHPAAIAARVKPAGAARLHAALQKVLREAIAAGGSTFRDFAGVNGEPGWFQIAHRVYGRAGRPCRRCRTTLRATIIAGRTTCYCPRCQKRS
jgi:formamidopyrimidine-DNA glycosylase